jgi:hypothetical protein
MTGADTGQMLAEYLERKARSHQRKSRKANTDRAEEHRASAAWLHRLAEHVLELDAEDWRLTALTGGVDLNHELRRFAKTCAGYACTSRRHISTQTLRRRRRWLTNKDAG